MTNGSILAANRGPIDGFLFTGRSKRPPRARNGRTIGQRISDGLLPQPMSDALYQVIWRGPYGADINGWSFVHSLSGALVAWRGIGATQAFIVHTVWELFQAMIGDNPPDMETVFDVTFDTVFFMAGWAAYGAFR